MCDITERSARGDCPGDDLHADQVCTEVWADAPFCSGPSMRECWDGSEVPEDQSCPSATLLPDCWVDENGCVGPPRGQTYPDFNSCEYDGTCDDGEGALDGAPDEFLGTTESTSTLDNGTPEVLAATGLDIDPIYGLVLAILLLIAGTFTVWNAR